MFCYLKRSA